MGPNEVSDEVLEALHLENMEEALNNYQEQVSPDIAFFAEHIEELKQLVAESLSRFKEMNNRRQNLALLAGVSSKSKCHKIYPEVLMLVGTQQ